MSVTNDIIIFALILIIILGFLLYSLYISCNDQYLFQYGILNYIKNILNITINDNIAINDNGINDNIVINDINKNIEIITKDKIDIETDKVDIIKNLQNIDKKKEVFNIDQNIFTYDEASNICKSYNSELATYNQLKESHKQGADWCNYGWSSNQMALYPTQKTTWEKLQKNENTKDNCGNPGINGGYFQDKNLKLGVNCYGYKPEPNPEQIVYIDDEKIQKQIDIIDLDKIDIRPFNNNKWSEYSYKKSSYIINPSEYNLTDNNLEEETILITEQDEFNKDPNIYIS